MRRQSVKISSVVYTVECHCIAYVCLSIVRCKNSRLHQTCSKLRICFNMIKRIGQLIGMSSFNA